MKNPIKKFIYIYIISIPLLLAGCGDIDEKFTSGGGIQEPCGVVKIGQGATVSDLSASFECTKVVSNSEGDALQDNSQTADPVFAIPAPEAVQGVTTVSTARCPVGFVAVPADDPRGPGCSDGSGGFVPLGGE